MFLSDVAIARPVFTAMMSIALIVMGVLAYRGLAVEQYPPVDFPIMLVQTVYPGAAPEDVERDVTKPIEDAVASVSGLDQLQSISRDSASIVILRFEMGTDLGDAVNTVRDKVGAVENDLPDGAEKPLIKQIDIGALPVMVVAMSSPGGTNAARALADERLRPFLEQVPGVGSVNIVGGQDREIHVDLDLDALRSLQISPDEVSQRIGYENLSVPAGQYDDHGYTIGVRAEGQFKSVQDVRDMIVKITQDGRQVRLSEVASVTDDWSRADRYVRFNRQEAVSIEVVKRSGANTVEVSKGVKKALEDVVPTLGDGVRYEVISDQSRDIEANADEVWMAIWFGGAAAVVVILFFLLDVRGTLISSLALPTSVIGTFAAMGALGFSLNTMTLLGLSLAIGLLIDDAVVVREAITKRLEAGDDPMTAASRGTKEIALAVLATTLSLVAVFVPVAFMSGIVGQFFKQFGLTIAVAVLLSLFVAFTLDPMLSSRLSRARAHHGHERRGGIAGAIEGVLDGIDRQYRGLLDWVLRHRKTTIALAVLTLVVTGILGTRVPVEFVPKEDHGEVIADMRLPIGTSIDETEKEARRMEALLMGVPGVERVYTIVGHEDQPNRARFRVRAIEKSKRDEPLSFYENAVRRILETEPGAEVTLTQPAIIEGLGDWPPIMVILHGDDLATLMKEANRLKGLMESVPGSSDVRLSVSPGRPELTVHVDRQLAADRGVPAGLAAMTARSMLEGRVVGTLRDGAREADIRVRAAPRFVDDATALAAIPVPSPRGLVSLGEIATIDMGAGAAEIQRFDRLRSVTLSSQVAPGAALGDVLGSFEKKMTATPLPPGYFTTIEGQAKDMKETSAAMGLAIAVALAFIYMVLASQFESLAHPFTLLVSVPLAMVGAVLGLWVAGKSFSMGSQIGMILLMGLVTKNAILLVDGALQQMRDGHPPLDAIKAAGPRRLRPILMTSAAMAFGMLPTAIGTGVGSEFRAPMAVAVIGGVTSSTFLTLLVVPIVFLWVEGWRERFGRLWAWLNPPVAATPSPAEPRAGADEAGQAAK